MKTLGIALAVIGLVMAGGGFWFYQYGPCGMAPVARARVDLGRLTERWDSQFAIAEATARINLTTPVSQLQALRDELVDLSVPACMVYAKGHLMGEMDEGISAFLAFMSSEPDSVQNAHFLNSGQLNIAYGLEMLRISECAPFCSPPD